MQHSKYTERKYCLLQSVLKGSNPTQESPKGSVQLNIEYDMSVDMMAI